MTPTPPADGGTPHALIERRGHVLIVTMNRPEARNALTGPLMALMQIGAYIGECAEHGHALDEHADQEGAHPRILQHAID